MAEQQSLIRQLDATDAQIEAFINRLDKFLSENLKRILRGLEKGKPSAERAAQALGGLQSSLVEAGLGAELRQLERIYGTQLKSINNYLGDISGKDHVLNEVDYGVTEQLIKFDTAVIANKVFALTDDLSSTIMRQVIAGETPDLAELTETATPRTISNIKTELNTSTIAFSRAITQKKANDLGLTHYLYVGPNDKITRPFCKARVGKVFTWEEIKKWDNGQGLPATIYCGGYNCRHDLRPITEERARALGYAD